MTVSAAADPDEASTAAATTARRDEGDLTSVKAIPFHGQESKWREWSAKVVAYATSKGWSKVILRDQPIPSSQLIDSGRPSEEEKKLYALNSEAYAFLILSTYKRAFAHVDRAKSPNLPNGDARAAWKALKKVYEGSEDRDKLAIQAEYNDLALTDFETDPDDFFNELAHYELRLEVLGIVKNVDEKKAKRLHQLPEEYSEQITTLESINTSLMSVEDFEHALRSFWKRKGNKQDGGKKGKGKNQAFTVMHNKKQGGGKFTKQFKGRCQKCGKIGHKAVDCRDGGGGQGGGNRKLDASKGDYKSERGKCWNCGETGHLKKDCPKPSSAEGPRRETGMFVGMVTDNLSEVDEEEEDSSPPVSEEQAGKPSPKGPKEDDDEIGWCSICRDVGEIGQECNQCKELDELRRSGMLIRGRYTPLIIGYCQVCDNPGPDGEKCLSSAECASEPDAYFKEDTQEDLAYVNRDEIGICPECDELGGLGLLCDSCEDSGMVYDRIEDYHIVMQRERWARHGKAVGTTKARDDPTFSDTTREPTYSDIESTKNKKKSKTTKTTKKDASIDMVEEVFRTTGISAGNRIFNVHVGDAWLIDGGATVHVTNNSHDLMNLEMCSDEVTVGDGRRVRAKAKGSVKLNLEGRRHGDITLRGVLYIPGFTKRIISEPKLLAGGCQVRTTSNFKHIEFPKHFGSVQTLSLSAEGTTHMFYIRGKAHGNNERKYESIHAAVGVSLDINKAHSLLGHAGEGIIRKTLSGCGYEFSGTMVACTSCLRAKATAKAVPKTASNPAIRVAQRLFVDSSGPYTQTIVGSRFWFLFVDDFSRKAWSFFGSRKSQLGKFLRDHVEWLGAKGHSVQYIRCDNAGENYDALNKFAVAKSITVEFTSPHTPQQNGVVERKFVTLRNRALAMMLDAQWDQSLQDRLWAEAVNTATTLDGMVVNSHLKREQCPDMVFYGAQPTLYATLIEFGRVGYVTIRDKRTRKLQPKATACLMVGYAPNHTVDTYRMYNPQTREVILSRDVRWAQWSEPPHPIEIIAGRASGNVAPETLNDDDDDMDPPADDAADDDDEDNSPTSHFIPDDSGDIEAGRTSGGSGSVGPSLGGGSMPPAASRSGRGRGTGRAQASRAEREARRLQTFYNPVVTHQILPNPVETEKVPTEAVVPPAEQSIAAMPEQIAPDDSVVANMVLTAAVLESDPGEPRNFKQAMSSPEKADWIGAMRKEVDNFLKRQVWKKVSKHQLKGRKPITCRWVFRKKTQPDGSIRYKARIVVKGYVQIPGVDFTETFAAVAGDSTIRTVLVYCLFMGWACEMIDVEAAFLEADLEEEIYIVWPEGLVDLNYITSQENDETCAKLMKAMYGCVQSPRQWAKKLKATLIKCGLIQLKTDPCVFVKLDDSGITTLILACFVDDILIIGPQKMVDWFKTELQKHHKASDLGPIKKHLGVWYERGRDRNGEYFHLSMEKFTTELVKDYEKETGQILKRAATPGYPGTTLEKQETHKPKAIDMFRSFLGRVMWYATKIGPDCSNAVRELASYMDNPGVEHWRSLDRVIGYLKYNTEPLTLRCPSDLRVDCYVDSNYATNKTTRRSVSGFISTIGGTPVNWSSKTQSIVALSSTEAEYVALSLCAQEAKFLIMLLKEIDDKNLRMPAIIREDNTGALHLVINRHVSARTKHIDIRYHFLRDLVEEGTIEAQFIKSEDNAADIETKNVDEATHTRNRRKFTFGNLSMSKSVAFCVDVEPNREDVRELVCLSIDSVESDNQDTNGIGLETLNPTRVFYSELAKELLKTDRVGFANLDVEDTLRILEDDELQDYGDEWIYGTLRSPDWFTEMNQPGFFRESDPMLDQPRSRGLQLSRQWRLKSMTKTGKRRRPLSPAVLGPKERDPKRSWDG